MSRTRKTDLLYLDVFNFVYLACLFYVSIYFANKLVSFIGFPENGTITVVIKIFFSFLCYCFFPAIIYFLLPKLKEGKHPFPKSPNSLIWTLKFYIKKPITLPLISNFIYTFHFLSYVLLKLQRSICSSEFQIAANTELRDPEFIKLGKNVTIGSNTVLAPHKMTQSFLELYNITIEDDVSIGAFCIIGPGVTIKKGAKIGTGVNIKPFSTIGERVIIGDLVTILERVSIGSKSIIKDKVIVKKESIIQSKSVVDLE